LVGNRQNRKILVFLLEENHIPHEWKNIDILKGEQNSEEFKKINLEGLVPVIVDEQYNLTLSEGAAIMIHLSETRKLEKWYPSDPAVRAKVNQFLHWHHTNTRKATITLLRLVLSNNEKSLPEAVANFKPILEKLDVYLKTPYLAGDSLTIADLLILPEIDQLVILKILSIDEYKNVKRWVEAVKSQLKTYDTNVATYHQFAKARGV